MRLPATTDKRTAIYARVSKADGTQTADNQTRILEQWAADRGLTVAAVYVEEISGASIRRPQLDAMLSAAHRRQFARVLFYRVDRLSRRGPADVFATLEKLEAAGVEYESYTEELVSNRGPAGRIFVAIAAIFAEMELQANRERTRAGIARAREQGKQLGRPRRVLDGKTLSEAAAAGASLRELAAAAGASKDTVQRRITDYRRRNSNATSDTAPTAKDSSSQGTPASRLASLIPAGD